MSDAPTTHVDQTIAELAPSERIRELEHQNRRLREMLDRAALRIALLELGLYGETEW